MKVTTEATDGQTHTKARTRKEEIVDVATRLFSERGYEGASMNDVAKGVGMPRKASLFYHFATKDALYEAVLDRTVGRLGRGAPVRPAGADGSFATRLDAAADAATAAFAAHPYAARLLLREAMDWGPILREKFLGQVLGVLEASAAFVTAGQAALEFVEGDPQQLILFLRPAKCISLPFALAELVCTYAGSGPFDARFVDERRVAVRTQLRSMLLRNAVVITRPSE